jgi:hypothetical protein
MLVVFLLSVSVSAQQSDAEPCTFSKQKTYPYGNVFRSQCGTAATGYRESIHLNGSPILSDTQLFDDDSNNDRSIRIYTSGHANAATGCAPRLYLIDFSKRPVKVIAFGVKKACNEFHWASWGEKRSVIALKHNVKFTYENGKMILPKPGEKLWSSIEPPHAGEGLAMEDATPFAEDVPPPK